MGVPSSGTEYASIPESALLTLWLPLLRLMVDSVGAGSGGRLMSVARSVPATLPSIKMDSEEGKGAGMASPIRGRDYTNSFELSHIIVCSISFGQSLGPNEEVPALRGRLQSLCSRAAGVT